MTSFWYDWECLDKDGKVIGYLSKCYNYEITTLTLEKDAGEALAEAKSEPSVCFLNRLGRPLAYNKGE